MNQRQRELWERIELFDIDGDDPAFPFAARLRRENGWSLDFADRVVGEYKRFVFLCMEAGHPCTPSEHIDQAWHLHLTYTRSYWDRLCGEVLERPLHHNPTRGGSAENQKFDDWYARTKQSYERLFGLTPPGDIWTHPEQRFGADLAWKRVNLSHYALIPQRLVRACAALLLLVAIVVVVAGCTRTTTGVPAAMIKAIGMLVIVGVASFMFFHAHRQATRVLPPERRRRGRAGMVVFALGLLGIIVAAADSMSFPPIGLGSVGQLVCVIASLVTLRIAGELLASPRSSRGTRRGMFRGAGGLTDGWWFGAYHDSSGDGGGCGSGGCGGCGGS